MWAYQPLLLLLLQATLTHTKPAWQLQRQALLLAQSWEAGHTVCLAHAQTQVDGVSVATQAASDAELAALGDGQAQLVRRAMILLMQQARLAELRRGTVCPRLRAALRNGRQDACVLCDHIQKSAMAPAGGAASAAVLLYCLAFKRAWQQGA